MAVDLALATKEKLLIFRLREWRRLMIMAEILPERLKAAKESVDLAVDDLESWLVTRDENARIEAELAGGAGATTRISETAPKDQG